MGRISLSAMSHVYQNKCRWRGERDARARAGNRVARGGEGEEGRRRQRSRVKWHAREMARVRAGREEGEMGERER